VASRDPERPNVLFVVADDLGYWAIGPYGNDEAETATLDMLAGEGIVFDNFFCTSPVCSPARASMLTGLIPSQHGVHDWIAAGHTGVGAKDYLTGRDTLYGVLSKAGYRPSLSGKWHLGASDQPRKEFVHWFAHQSGGGPYWNAPMVRGHELVRAKGYLTDVLADDAIDVIDAEVSGGSREPFLLHLHFTAPHSPWVGVHPPELVALFDECEFRSVPRGDTHPWLLLHNGEVREAIRSPFESLKGYFAAVAGLDRALGRVLEALRRRGLMTSTLVVFLSDNGFNAGHHGIWGKGNGTYPQNMYDTSVKVPAIFAQPGRIKPGRREELVSGYDVLVTLLEYLHVADARIERVASPGRSFAELLESNSGVCAQGAGRGFVVVFDEYGPVRMVRTKDWKYVWRWNGPEELYDLAADAGETRNLAEEAALAGTRETLRKELEVWFARYADPRFDGKELPVTGLGQTAPIEPPGSGGFVSLPEEYGA